jgi:hypothetical protein
MMEIKDYKKDIKIETIDEVTNIGPSQNNSKY